MKSASTSSSPNGLAALRLAWQQRFSRLAVREQRLIILTTWILGLAALWWIGIAPALQTLNQAQARQKGLDEQWQQMLRLQAQAQQLQTQPNLSRNEIQRALESSLRQHFNNTAQLQTQGDRATVTFKAASPQTLVDWLAQVRLNAHLLPTEAHWTRNNANASNTSNVANATNSGASNRWDGLVILPLPSQ